MTQAAPADDALAEFEAELLGGGTATRVLEARVGGRIRAEAVGASSVAVGRGVRDLLACAANEAVAHRHTRLMHGDVALSDADLWYLPARLTAAMNHALAVGDTPFGAVIGALGPTRRTIAMTRTAGAHVLYVRAIVLAADGRPLALADERYARAALG